MLPSEAVNVMGRSPDPVTKHLTIKAQPFPRSASFSANDCKGYRLSREGAPRLQIPRLICLLSQLVVKIRDELKKKKAASPRRGGNRPRLISVIGCLRSRSVSCFSPKGPAEPRAG